MKIAKVFRSGNSQAVRLPKEFRFHAKEVVIEKQGEVVTLRPHKGAWDAWIANLSRFSEDFLQKRQQPPHQKRKALFK